jgi:hypothetical protein
MQATHLTATIDNSFGVDRIAQKMKGWSYNTKGI